MTKYALPLIAALFALGAQAADVPAAPTPHAAAHKAKKKAHAHKHKKARHAAATPAAGQ
jgi:hypothetical protein